MRRPHPHGHWKTFTVVAAPCPDRIFDHMTFDGAMIGEGCRIQMSALVKNLRPGDPVICDNLAVHKVPGIREIMRKKGEDIRSLQPYSPEFNYIEKAIPQLKSGLRKD